MSTKFCLVKKQRNLNPTKICASTLCFITFSCLLKVRYLRYVFYAQIIYFLEWSDHILCTPSISHTVYSYTIMYHCTTTRNSSTKLHNKVILYNYVFVIYIMQTLLKPCPILKQRLFKALYSVNNHTPYFSHSHNIFF